jgi:glycosyltransferase involved in cell wall biosynthesis
VTDKRKILFLTVGGRNTASSRYRVFKYLPFLEDAGYTARVLSPAPRKGKGLRRLFQVLKEQRAYLDAAGQSDIVFIQKRLFGKKFLRRLKGLGKKVVFDLDDNVFVSQSGSWSKVTRRKVACRIRAVLEVSSLVIAGNNFLAGLAREGGAARVEVLPTCIDTGKYRLKDHRSGKPAILGWIGSSVNHPYLDMLSGMLPLLGAGSPDLGLLVISDKDYGMDGIRVMNRRWSEDTEVEDLLDMDIGLMPLPDDDWTRGKCAFKALQYMACGIPVVCSAVGVNKEIVTDGIDGLLADTDREWLAALSCLMEDPQKRTDVGLAGRDTVVSRYSLVANVSRLIEIMDTI